MAKKKSSARASAKFPNLPRETTLLVAIEAGASHLEMETREEGEVWKSTIFGEARSDYSRTPVTSMPTMAAVHDGGELLYGLEAADALNSRPGFHQLAYLKLALIEEGKLDATTKKLMAEQRQKARGFGLDIEKVAVGFFTHALGFLDAAKWDKVIVHINISDVWRSDVAQALSRELTSILPRANIRPIGECLASAMGEQISDGMAAIFDIGHATMNCSIAICGGSGKDLSMQFPAEHALGAGKINEAVERKAREIGKPDAELVQLDHHVNTFVKQNTGIPRNKLGGWTDWDWAQILETVQIADIQLIAEQHKIMKEYMDIIKANIEKGHKDVCGGTAAAVLSGGGTRGAVFRNNTRRFFEDKYPNVSLRHNTEYETSVMRGMKRIAETPGLCNIEISPLSIYLHSGDEQAVRFHRQGQDLSGRQLSMGDHHPLCFMAFELSTQAPGNVELDLSIYCDEDAEVPSGDQSTNGNKGTKRKRKRMEMEAHRVEHYQVHKPTKVLTTLGRFTKELEIQNPAPGQVYTAYVFVKLQRFWADVFAVHTKSGDAVPKLESEIIDNVIFNGKLRESWTRVGQDQVVLVALGQVVRSETFGASSFDDFSHEAVRTVQSGNEGNPDDTVAKPVAKRARRKAKFPKDTVVDESDID